MKTLYEAANAAEAHMLVDLLRQQGISAQVEGEYLQGAVGGLPAAGLVRLVADEQDFPRARAVIAQWEAADAAEDAPAAGRQQAPSRYRGLMGFVLGLILGIGGMYAAYRIPAVEEGVDYNRDRVLDRKWTHAANGSPLKLEMDRNRDGKMDYIAHYGVRGLVESADLDDDFNGTFETKIVFQNGHPLTGQVDTDGDGFPDLVSHYKDGVLDSVEYIQPTTGLPLRVEHFRLGKLVFADIDSDGDGRLDTRLTYSALGEVAARRPVSEAAGK